MKITIDTKEDSHEDIIKILALLSRMVEDSSGHNANIFEEPSSNSEISSSVNSESNSGSNAFVNMFGSSGANEDVPVLGAVQDNQESSEESEEPTTIIEY